MIIEYQSTGAVNFNWHFHHGGKLYQYNLLPGHVVFSAASDGRLSEFIVAVWYDKKFRNKK